jgi:pantoate--beta-alanine ligase
MQQLSDAWRNDGLRVGCVPTMGALHAGHLSLVRRAAREADRVVVTLFVNPAQFGPMEDFDKYPRDFDADRRLLAPEGVDAIFAPEASEMYPDGFSSRVEVKGLTQRLCGASRPGHFEGVATVVTKLFIAVNPNFAVFGQKDAQQALIIRRLTADLGFGVDIRISPTVRDPDGLARSSRNRYLSEPERRWAVRLFQALQVGSALVRGGERCAESVVEGVRISLSKPIDIDYVEAVDPHTLKTVSRIDSPTLLAIAVQLGRTRLIDNLILKPESDDEVRA